MESDTNLKSCIQVYIQQLKNNKKIFFQKNHFLKSYALFIFWYFNDILEDFWPRRSTEHRVGARQIVEQL